MKLNSCSGNKNEDSTHESTLAGGRILFVTTSNIFLLRTSLVGMTEGLPFCLMNEKFTTTEKWSSPERWLVEYSCSGRRKEDFMERVINSRRKSLV